MLGTNFAVPSTVPTAAVAPLLLMAMRRVGLGPWDVEGGRVAAPVSRSPSRRVVFDNDLYMLDPSHIGGKRNAFKSYTLSMLFSWITCGWIVVVDLLAGATLLGGPNLADLRI